MRRLLPVTAAALLACAVAAATAAPRTWTNVPMIDRLCETTNLDEARKHDRGCSLSCKSDGFGVIVDGAFLKLDDQGNTLAVAALEKSTRPDDIRVTVTGDLEGAVIKVTALTIVE